VPLLRLNNTVDGFLCTEFRIVECFPRCSIHCVNVVRLPVLMFHLNEHVSHMWREGKTFFKWDSVAILLARKDLSTHLGVSRTRVWRTLHDDRLYSFHRTACSKSPPRGQCYTSRICLIGYILIAKSPIAFINTIH
jgi:hypothetical protein